MCEYPFSSFGQTLPLNYEWMILQRMPEIWKRGADPLLSEIKHSVPHSSRYEMTIIILD